MNDEFGRRFRVEVRLGDGFLVLGHQQLALVLVFVRVKDESGVDDIPRQREHVEGAVYEMIPLSSYVQATNFAVTPSFVFN